MKDSYQRKRKKFRKVFKIKSFEIFKAEKGRERN